MNDVSCWKNLVCVCVCSKVNLTRLMFSRWPFKEDDGEDIRPLIDQHMALNHTEEAALHGYIMKLVNCNYNQN